jgi:hypothetical protein
VTAQQGGRGIVMTTTFLGSVTRLGVLLDEDVMVYVDQPNSAIQVPVGSAAEVTLTERDVMVADRTVARSASTPPASGAETESESARDGRTTP